MIALVWVRQAQGQILDRERWEPSNLPPSESAIVALDRRPEARKPYRWTVWRDASVPDGSGTLTCRAAFEGRAWTADEARRFCVIALEHLRAQHPS